MRDLGKKKVCEKRLEQAKEGNDSAIAWLERYVLGSNQFTLTDLAIRDYLGIADDAALGVKAEQAIEEIPSLTNRLLESEMPSKPVLLRVLEFMERNGKLGTTKTFESNGNGSISTEKIELAS